MNHLYEDRKGILHTCEGTTFHRNVYLVWTRCGKDVPANTSFKSEELSTCNECKEPEQGGEKP